MSDARSANRASERTVSERVVNAVAEHRGVAPDALTPLYEVVDPESLERVFESPEETAVSVEFVYAGCTVTIDTAGAVAVVD